MGVQPHAHTMFLLLFLLCGVSFAAVPDGYVVRVDTPTIYLDWGTSSGVKPGDPFIVYRPGAALKHPITGELLGHAEVHVNAGGIERVEEKFSIGRLLNHPGKLPRAGDRVRLDAGTSAAVPLAPAPEAARVPDDSNPGGLKMAWESQALSGEPAVSLTVADLDGDGKKEIVVAGASKITVYDWDGKTLQPLTTFQHKTYRHWLGVEAADLKKAGRDTIFATAYFDATQRPRVIVLSWDNGRLKQEADLEGMVRRIDRADGSRQIAFQDLSRSKTLSYSPPVQLVFENNAYKPGQKISVPSLRDKQAFGFTFGDWDHDQSEDTALLENGDRLRVFFKSSKWASSSDSFGGTANDFSTVSNSMPDENTYNQEDRVGTFLPRLMTWRPSSGSEQILVPHNIPALSFHLTYYKPFKKSELFGYAWNGLAMTPVWHVAYDGYLADYAIGDALNDETAQVWAAVVSSGKTHLLAYRLP